MTALVERLDRALSSGLFDGLASAIPVDRRDRFLTLLRVYDLRLGALCDASRWAAHPAVAELVWRLETDWLLELSTLADPLLSGDVVAGMRALAARDRLPQAYEWLARDASWPEVVRFLALEGGPDGGFDDLVAACQLGLHGAPKMELATNYWDEMGNGRPAAVHTTLHDRLVAAIDMPRVPLSDQPVSALERAALGGLLATNHWLQPEMLGALGLIELQAGPRCRKVLQAFDRLSAPEDAYPFYAEHAEVDPRHGKDWLDNAIVPTIAEHPDWAPRILRGALWRSTVNAAFFTDLHRTMTESRSAA
ncbi:MAG TPA: iron-containing redox enzyme family protein [Frankiaceae bacterium]|nr:iron-containing redox enzyme family protein [Frankiaceae bacterium]